MANPITRNDNRRPEANASAPTEGQLKTLAERIDAHFDAMLYDGMDHRAAVWVEQQREDAHAELLKKMFEVAVRGYAKHFHGG